MGIIDKLRGELVDIIEWVDDSRHTLVWRFPRYHNQIKNGAQLIVRPGQMALFIHKGQIADLFEPGTYRLDTENLPILSTLQGWRHGFESPFKAEVYFISTRQVTDLKWGTPNPIIIRDQDFGPVRVRAFGTYTLKACDSRALLEELVGTDQEFDTEEIAVLLRSIIGSAFADLVAGSGISVLDLAASYGELSEQLRRMVVERVDDEYGLDVPQLWIVNISVPEEVEKALDARSSIGVIGNLAMYQHYQLGHAMPVAAANPAGGLAGAGVGLGMGMAVAGQMLPPHGGWPGGPAGGAYPGGAYPGGAAGPGGGSYPTGPGGGVHPGAPAGGSPAAGAFTGAAGLPPATGHTGRHGGAEAGGAVLASPPAVPHAPSSWHLVEDGQTVGPLSLAQVVDAVASGRIQPETLIWNETMADWAQASQVPALQPLFGAAPPPPPPARRG